MELAGRVAVITGAASGIGFGLAEQAARRGMSLVLADVEANALGEAARRLEGAGARTLAVPTDVSRADQVEALADRAFGEFGEVGLLCNNAGVNVLLMRPIWELTRGDWEWVLGVNQWGVINGVTAFLPRMMEQRSASHILNTSSAAGLMAGPGLATYKASKHAILSISETLYHDLARVDSRVGVSAFCPDVVKTRLYDADRNRPTHLRDERPANDEEAAAEESAESAPGLAPSEAAEIALKGVETGRFYIFTHPWALSAARERLEDMEAGVPRPTTLRDA